MPINKRIIKVVNAHGKYYIPLIGQRWLRRWFKRRNDAEEYRKWVQWRYEAMKAC